MDSPKISLILGGARSGKSAYAQNLAEQSAARVLFVATAQAGDAEMKNRIKKHQQNRPSTWINLETPLNVGREILNFWGNLSPDRQPQMILVDCMTLLVSNIILAQQNPEDEEMVENAINEEYLGFELAFKKIPVNWMIISNEVGLGLVPPYPVGRVYRDALGRFNQQLAAIATEVNFLVAGVPLRIK